MYVKLFCKEHYAIPEDRPKEVPRHAATGADARDVEQIQPVFPQCQHPAEHSIVEMNVFFENSVFYK